MRKPSTISTSCLHCPARCDGICTELTSADLSRIISFKSGDRRIRAGKDIISPGETSRAIYNLVDGWAFRYGLLDDGRRQILDFILPGAVVGFQTVNGAKATYGVQALTDTVVCVVRHEDLLSFARDVPGIGLRLAWLISRDRSLAYDHLTSVGRQSAQQRVAHLILELFVRFRAQWPGKRIEEMNLPLTQEHIADATGLTGVHVNRVLRDLREGKVLEFHYKRLRVLNPDKLVEIAETDPHVLMHWTSRPRQTEDTSVSEPLSAGFETERTGHSEEARRAPASARTMPL